MTTPRRRVLRPARATPTADPGRDRQVARRQLLLDQEPAAFDRWMTGLRRAGNEVARRRKRIARLERQISRLRND